MVLYQEPHGVTSQKTPFFTDRVVENRVLKRIFDPKRDELTGEWRKLHMNMLHNLEYSQALIITIKSKRM
jgi:hypothetical protein